MNCSFVQFIFGVGQAQKSRALFKCLGAKALDLFQLGTAGKFALFLTVGYNIFGCAARNTRHTAQQRRAGGVQVHTHAVHAVFHHAVQRFFQPLLRHIVLVLAHAHGFGFNFHQFCQGVLQAAGNGNGAAQIDIKLRELGSSQLAGRIHRSAGLAYHHILHTAADLTDHIGGKHFGFLAGGAVANGNDLHTVLFNKILQNFLGLLHTLEFRHGIDHRGVQHLAGGIHHRHLTAHAIAGVQPKRHFALDGRLQQKLAQVISKHRDRAFVGGIGKLGADLGVQAGMDQAFIGIQRRLQHLLCAGAAGFFAGKQACAQCPGALGVHLDIHLQIALALAAVQRQHTVPGNFAYRLGEIIVRAVHAVLFLCAHAAHLPKCMVKTAQLGAAAGIVAHSFGNNIPCALQSLRRVGHLLVQVVPGGGLGVSFGILRQDQLCQRLQPFGLGHAGTGFALGLIGAVEILHLGQRGSLFQLGSQLLGHGPLLGDAAAHFVLALIQSAQIFQPFAQLAQQLIVHAVGGFLAVTRNKGNGVALVDQGNGVGYMDRLQVEFLGNFLCVIRHGFIPPVSLLFRACGGGSQTDTPPTPMCSPQPQPHFGQGRACDR